MITRRRFPAELDAAALRQQLHTDGVAVITVDGFPELLRVAELSPWRAAEQLLGVPVLLAEQQTIRAIPGGTTFSSGNMVAPPHTDSQVFLGAPPDVQLMLCAVPAESGGDNVYVDTWALMERLSVEDPALLNELFTVPRRVPLVYGDHHGPTVSWRRGRVVFTHVSTVVAGDDVSRRLQDHVERAPTITWNARQGDILLLDNHRMLHGRTAFSDEKRRFLRVLAWLQDGLPVHPGFAQRARQHAAPGLPLTDDPAADRLHAVLELLRGAAPGVVSSQTGVPEGELYRWRETALEAARQALRADALAPSVNKPGWRGRLRSWLR